ncbi:MAG: threonylcarbamoyl-AMP synthase [Planctomycetes bacterium]|nr:threonylcarbamoyl-AMP synthase [Planctomycetota bacterium]
MYGLGARGLDPACVARIFAAKGRPAENPLILHIRDFNDALPLWRIDSAEAEAAVARAEILAKAFWPGPLTIICYKSDLVPDITTANLNKVAVRAPDHAVARQLIQLVGEPLAAPSANASGRVSPTTAAHVLESLNNKIDAVVDGGTCAFGLESTVVDVTKDHPVILRPGALSEARLAELFPDIHIREAGAASVAREASPGLLAKHYAPSIARVELIETGEIVNIWSGGAALLLRHSTAKDLLSQNPARRGRTEILSDDPVAFARELYAALYRLERTAPSILYIENPPAGAQWRAVADRVARASAKTD